MVANQSSDQGLCRGASDMNIWGMEICGWVLGCYLTVMHHASTGAAGNKIHLTEQKQLRKRCFGWAVDLTMWG